MNTSEPLVVPMCLKSLSLRLSKGPVQTKTSHCQSCHLHVGKQGTLVSSTGRHVSSCNRFPHGVWLDRVLDCGATVTVTGLRAHGVGQATDKNNIDPAVTETLLCGTHGILEKIQVLLLKPCFRQRERSMSSISIIAHVSEDKVRLAHSHCVLRQTSLPVEMLIWLDEPADLPWVGAFNSESDVNLLHTTWDPIEIELPKQIVVLGHRTLPSKT